MKKEDQMITFDPMTDCPTYARCAARTRSRDTKEELSHLHVVIPLEAHRRARIMATRSGLLLKNYLAKLLMSAEPIGETAAEVPKEPSVQVAQGNAPQENLDE